MDEGMRSIIMIGGRVVFGAVGWWAATQKNRSGPLWFFFGVIFPPALLALPFLKARQKPLDAAQIVPAAPPKAPGEV